MNFLYGLLLLLASSFRDLQAASDYSHGEYINSWAAEIVGGQDVARDVAEQHGYRIVRSLDHIPDHYELERSDIPHRSRRGADHHTQKLSDDRRVRFVEQQQHKTRVKREVPREVVDAYLDNINDPEFKNQWYLVQEGSTSPRRDKPNSDLKVRDVWARNITGRGAVVCIVDDGVDYIHPDLNRNYLPAASTDLNGNDDDPSPRYDPTNENKHGTRCAGEVSMVANNNICGTGIAPDALFGGIRMLDGSVTDSIESRALSFNRNVIDIFSSSWGPSDNGRACEGPGKLTQRALEDGVKLGRKGRGSLFFVASGNGGASGDNCNCDGYTGSMFTISISGVSQNGKMPYYAERCSSTLASAFSSGSYSEGKVISADLHNKCTNAHSGTSAAAPMAAGIAALLLEVNPNLSWREVQHIVIEGSEMISLEDNNGWYRNGAGYCVNLAFGFGLMNALKIVTLGNPKTWKGIGEQRTCRVEPAEDSGFPQKFKSGEAVEVEFNTDGCEGQKNEIRYLEHVTIKVHITHERRGQVFVELESPMGTRTALLLERPDDASTAGFNNWTFMTLHNWGEQPRGTWILRVADRSNGGYSGSLNNATITLYGTKEQPEHQKNRPKLCENLKQYADTLTDVIPVIRDGSTHNTFTSGKASSSPKVSLKAKSGDNHHESYVETLKKLLQSFSR
jgi:proprotein convertase subtilisin/kexin type 1